MKKLLIALFGVLLLAGCSPKVAYTSDNEDYKITVFEKKCSDSKVLETFINMGAPKEVIDELKQGEVVIKVGPRQGSKVAVCAIEAGPLGKFPGKVFIADAEGSAGYITIKAPKPMKDDIPGPGQKGT